MPTYRLLFATALLAGLSAPALSQRLDIEKTHDVSGKARRGYLSDVRVNEAANRIDLEFCTKSTDKQVKTQTYHFDTKYNLLGVDENTIPVEKVKGYRGENYSKEGVTLALSDPSAGMGAIPMLGMVNALKNPAGTLLLQRKRIDYKWSWLGGGYRKKIKLLGTEKPKTESGAGYRHIAHVDDDVNGGVLVLAAENMKLSKMSQTKPGYHLLYFNSQLELVRDTYLEPDGLTAQTFVQMDAIGLDQDEEADDSQQPARDVAIMLTYPKGAGKEKDKHPATEYQYLRTSADGQVKEKIRVDTPVGAWLVSGFIPMTDGSVLAYGPANDSPDKHYADALPDAKDGMTPEEAFKAKNFLLGKIQKGAVAWITKTPLKEFEDKQQVPAGQKRTPDYTGKRFMVRQALEAGNGDILISGQNFKVHGGGLAGNKMLNTLAGGSPAGPAQPTRSYADLLLFQFSGQGQLRSQYGLRRAENNDAASANPTSQFLTPTANGQGIYWRVFEIDGWRTVDETQKGLFTITEKETIMYPSVTRIELAKATIGPQKTFGVTKEGKYYVNNHYQTLDIGDGRKQIVYFGENKSGKTMWFAQMPLE
ncbi:hypothetical protein [Hymenobacter guriensis]|uniref:WG repeat-containing protein n=1 Tax=Hymenobacter guriensis TaxID=2793065 RepID=A0ABS0L6W8_9BACT|nr:hypothetical protein [Hymenobacter guriensis]MBG8555873.1 hypothetical protein [Hymenobacter guriensis]